MLFAAPDSLSVIASAATQSRVPKRIELDCFASLAMTRMLKREAETTRIRGNNTMPDVSRLAALAMAMLLLSTIPSRAEDPLPGVPRELLEDIATGSRVLANLGVVDAFGHVSA